MASILGKNRGQNPWFIHVTLAFMSLHGWLAVSRSKGDPYCIRIWFLWHVLWLLAFLIKCLHRIGPCSISLINDRCWKAQPAVYGTSAGQVDLGCLKKTSWASHGDKPVSSMPPCSRLLSLPPGSCVKFLLWISFMIDCPIPPQVAFGSGFFITAIESKWIHTWMGTGIVLGTQFSACLPMINCSNQLCQSSDQLNPWGCWWDNALFLSWWWLL